MSTLIPRTALSGRGTDAATSDGVRFGARTRHSSRRAPTPLTPQSGWGEPPRRSRAPAQAFAGRECSTGLPLAPSLPPPLWAAVAPLRAGPSKATPMTHSGTVDCSDDEDVSVEVCLQLEASPSKSRGKWL